MSKFQAHSVLENSGSKDLFHILYNFIMENKYSVCIVTAPNYDMAAKVGKERLKIHRKPC